MQSMSVNTAQVTASASQIRNGARQIRTELDTLESAVGALRAQWTGEAQVAYDQAQLKWNASVSAMQELLERIASSTEQIAQSYDATDRRNASLFGQ